MARFPIFFLYLFEMLEIIQLVELVDSKIKNNIKDGDYLKLMTLISKIYRKFEEDYASEQEEESDIYGSY